MLNHDPTPRFALFFVFATCFASANAASGGLFSRRSDASSGRQQATSFATIDTLMSLFIGDVRKEWPAVAEKHRRLREGGVDEGGDAETVDVRVELVLHSSDYPVPVVLKALAEKNLTELLGSDRFYTNFNVSIPKEDKKKWPKKHANAKVDAKIWIISSHKELLLIEKRMWLTYLCDGCEAGSHADTPKRPCFIVQQEFIKIVVNVFLESLFLEKFWTNNHIQAKRNFHEAVENVGQIELTLPGGRFHMIGNTANFSHHERAGAYLRFDIGTAEQKTWPAYRKLIGKKVNANILSKDGSKSAFSAPMFIIADRCTKTDNDGETIELSLDKDPLNNPTDMSRFERCSYWCCC